MRAAINKVLDQFEVLYSDDVQALDPPLARLLIKKLQPVQDAYVEVIQQALMSLARGDELESHNLLQAQRDQLGTTFDRIATLVEEVSESREPLFKLVIEYLFTRTRLVDELKMFPKFGFELVDRLAQDDDLDETILYMEKVMTGKRDLYQDIQEIYADLGSEQST